MEEEQQHKGQADALEGKIKISAESITGFSSETKLPILSLPSRSQAIFSTQDVNSMPIFCLSTYTDDDITVIDNTPNFTLTYNEIERIKTDFEKATHALVILEPELFIADVHRISGYRIVDDFIRYYDFNIKSIAILHVPRNW